MIPSPNHEARSGSRVRLVVLHTSEGARDVVSLGNFLSNPSVQASYHVAFDDQRMEQLVTYDQACWSTLTANSISDNGCCCAFSAWSHQEWLSHTIMLELAAQWVASRCIARSLPIRHLSTSEVAACRADPRHPGGVIGHWDWTVGAQDGSHTDPGPNFPWDTVISRAQQIAGGQPAAKTRKEHTDMIQLPATPLPADAATSDPKSWPGRNFDVPWNISGGWEGGAAFSFGVQDWGGRGDGVRGFLAIASWMMPGGKLAPVNAGLTQAGGGLVLAAHTLTPEYAAPAGCVGVTLNYAAPNGAYVALGRSG